MQFREDFLEILRTCLSEAEDWYGVERCFRAQIDAENDDEVEDARPVVFAFAYELLYGNISLPSIRTSNDPKAASARSYGVLASG
jgi:hypothetical protein